MLKTWRWTFSLAAAVVLALGVAILASVRAEEPLSVWAESRVPAAADPVLSGGDAGFTFIGARQFKGAMRPGNLARDGCEGCHSSFDAKT